MSKCVGRDGEIKETASSEAVVGLKQTDALARIVNSAFEAQNEWLEQQFAAVRLDLDVRKRLDRYDRKFRKLEHALNVKL